jgi:hypothetical protein
LVWERKEKTNVEETMDSCGDAVIEWIDDQTAVINGITLNVLKETWDYRKQQ